MGPAIGCYTIEISICTMGKAHHPRRGSLQYCPRARAKKSLARIGSWAHEGQTKPLGFIGYKAGMAHLQIIDNRPKSLTKGEKVMIATTVMDCPPLLVIGVVFYKNTIYGLQKIYSWYVPKLSKEMSRKFAVAKKSSEMKEPASFDDLRLLVQSQPRLTTTGSKKPKVMELPVGGNKESRLGYVKNMLGKELSVSDVFDKGVLVDVHGITKGKGFQGTVKRYGVPIRHHKSEKTKRGIGTLGAWTPKRVDFRTAQPGKMGYHLRTDYNKQIIKIGISGEEINPSGGIPHYGLVRNTYLFLKGSVIGPKRRAIVLTKSIRPRSDIPRDAPEIAFTSKVA